MDQRLAYTHNNPVEASFVDEPQAWTWSSCRSYETGVVDIVPLYYIQ